MPIAFVYIGFATRCFFFISRRIPIIIRSFFMVYKVRIV